MVFDAADAANFTEIVETIETDELVDEWGDFIENFSTTRQQVRRFRWFQQSR